MILDADRRDNYSPLADSGLPRSALQRLAALGITTLQELRDLCTHGDRRLLADYLGESAGLEPMPDDPRKPLAATRAEPLVKRPRGVALLPSQRRHRADLPGPVPTRPKSRSNLAVSLVDAFPPIRDQGLRGTCVAFASGAFLEYHLYGGMRRSRRHSEQFLYWACKEGDGIPGDEGTFVRTAREVLKLRGACLSGTWRYRPFRTGAAEGQGPPPSEAIAEALRFTRDSVEAIDPVSVASIRESLDRDRPVVLSVYTFPEWDFRTTQETGEVPMPLPGSQVDGAHAVCVVGYEWNERSPGGGAFLIRNSWGKGWGRPHGRFGPGYGTLFFDYVKTYGLEAFG